MYLFTPTYTIVLADIVIESSTVVWFRLQVWRPLPKLIAVLATAPSTFVLLQDKLRLRPQSILS